MKFQALAVKQFGRYLHKSRETVYLLHGLHSFLCSHSLLYVRVLYTPLLRISKQPIVLRPRQYHHTTTSMCRLQILHTRKDESCYTRIAWNGLKIPKIHNLKKNTCVRTHNHMSEAYFNFLT